MHKYVSFIANNIMSRDICLYHFWGKKRDELLNKHMKSYEMTIAQKVILIFLQQKLK